MWLTTRGNPFVTLARSIVGQQISVKAAESVWQRFLATCGRRPTPASVQRSGMESLRSAGLSQRKAEYILDLSTHFREKQVHPNNWIAFEKEVRDAFSYEEAMAVIRREFDVVPT